MSEDRPTRPQEPFMARWEPDTRVRYLILGQEGEEGGLAVVGVDDDGKPVLIRRMVRSSRHDKE